MMRWRSNCSARQPETRHMPRTEAGRCQSRSTPDGSCREDPLVEDPQHTGSRAPDVTIAIRHFVEAAGDVAELAGGAGKDRRSSQGPQPGREDRLRPALLDPPGGPPAETARPR